MSFPFSDFPLRSPVFILNHRIRYVMGTLLVVVVVLAGGCFSLSDSLSQLCLKGCPFFTSCLFSQKPGEKGEGQVPTDCSDVEEDLWAGDENSPRSSASSRCGCHIFQFKGLGSDWYKQQQLPSSSKMETFVFEPEHCMTLRPALHNPRNASAA